MFQTRNQRSVGIMLSSRNVPANVSHRAILFLHKKKLNFSTVSAVNSGDFTSSRLFIRDPVTNFSFLIDTEADVYLISKHSFKHFNSKVSHHLSAANGSLIAVYGTKLFELELRTLGVKTFF